MLNVGDTLVANWNERLMDHVTQGKHYPVVAITEVGFWIVNDKGQKCFPIATSFSRVLIS